MNRIANFKERIKRKDKKKRRKKHITKQYILIVLERKEKRLVHLTNVDRSSESTSIFGERT